jgi:HSP20 family protein
MFNLTPWKQREDGNRELTPRGQQPVSRLHDEFNALFNRFFGNWPVAAEGDWGRFWDFHVNDTGKEVVVRAEAPGFEAGDFDLQVSGNRLTIHAERKQRSEEKEGTSHYEERRLQRSVTLPPGTDTENVEARYRNGVLEVRLPKAPEAQGKRIEVKS